MKQKLHQLATLIGETPVVKLKHNNINLYSKLEYFNYSGSIKDRPAYNIIKKGIEEGLINKKTTIVESSSGNFAIALASICNELGLQFIAVIDPHINRGYEDLLKRLATSVVKVDQPDETNGYLLTRIQKVNEICASLPDSFWPNQYKNPNNYLSYYQSLGGEITKSFNKLDYVFISVSSGGTLTGTSLKLKESFPDIKVVAVDIEGSVIFQPVPQKRFISGIGASMVPDIIQNALIDHVIHISQSNVIKGAHELLKEQTIFAGASAGAAYFAIKQFFKNNLHKTLPNVLFICPDKGYTYLDTVYNDQWCTQIEAELSSTVANN